MYKPCVFIISKRKELSIKHKKLIENLNCEVILINELSSAIAQIKLQEPELIIISDTIDDILSDFLKKIRVLTFNFRPILIALSKSNELGDRLSAFDSGADDFLDETMPAKEFQARINAHIRRHLENSINQVTGFIDNKLILKAIKKTVNIFNNRAYMLINISGINFYKEIYGQIAYEKVLQTLGAIINSTLQSEDTVGHFSPKEFLLITSSCKAEKIAEFLTFAFDSILDRFYSEFDYKNKFMPFGSDSKEEKKIPLMKLSTAVLLEGNFKDEKEVLNLLFNVLKLAKQSKVSTYIIDRPKISGTVSPIEIKNKILIMEPDEALNCLIETACNIKNFNVVSCLDYEKFNDIFLDFKPDIVILDYGSEFQKEGIKILEETKKRYQNARLNMPKIIFSTSLQDKKTILSKGADLYLPKPYDINKLIGWIEKFIKDN